MASSHFRSGKTGQIEARPIANFQQDVWGDYFLSSVPDDHCHVQAAQANAEEQVKVLKDEVQQELLATSDQPLKQLCFIDTLERLGVAYHFEAQIEEALRTMYCTYRRINVENDLYHTSLLFRVLRQHGFPISCDLFDKFINRGGGLKECICEDIRGMLALYEASHLRVHGEAILDEAVIFVTTHLKNAVDKSNDPIMAQIITHALKLPLHKGLPRLESRAYILFYELNPSHNKSLLKFAKLDYNMLQSLHRKELKDLSQWWRDFGFAKKLPFVRERVAEAYFWGMGVFYEPHYALGRKIASRTCLLVTIVDDFYDAYGTIEELELFTDAVERWDIECLNKLPDYMQFTYQHLVLDLFEEFQQDLAKEGRSDCVDYAREQLKVLCRAYFQEAKWCHEKHDLSYDEYMRNATMSIAYGFATCVTHLGMGKMATEETFKWFSEFPKVLRASCTIARLKDDIGGNEFQKDRDHIASAAVWYMRQYNVSQEMAYKVLNEKVNEAWKDVVQEMLLPTSVPRPLLNCILNLTRVVEVLYNGGEDHYTSVGQHMKNVIKESFIEPISL